MGWFSSFCSSVCSVVSTACRATVNTISRVADKVGTFCKEKVAPAIRNGVDKLGTAIAAVGTKMQKKKTKIVEAAPTRDHSGQIKTKTDGEREREMIDFLRRDANESFDPIVSDMLIESSRLYNDMKNQWETEFQDLDLSRESYDIQKARERLRNVVKNEVKRVVSPSDRRFKDIMSLPAGSSAREEATESFIQWIIKRVRVTFNETVDVIFSEQIEHLFNKVEDYVSMSEKQSQKEVAKLKDLVAEEESGAAAKGAVIAESYAMLQKCDYIAEVLERDL